MTSHWGPARGGGVRAGQLAGGLADGDARSAMLQCLTRLNDKATQKSAADQLAGIIRTLDADGLAALVQAICATGSWEPKPFAKKECVRALAQLPLSTCPAAEAALGQHLPKVLAHLRRSLQDADGLVREAACSALAAYAWALAEASGCLLPANSGSPIVRLVFECLAEQKRSAQLGASQALLMIAPCIEPLERDLVKAVLRHLKSATFQGTAPLLAAVASTDPNTHAPAGLLASGAAAFLPYLHHLVGQPGAAAGRAAAGGIPLDGGGGGGGSGLLGCLASKDWAARRAAADAIRAAVLLLGPALEPDGCWELGDPGSLTQRCLGALEGCRFDKVKEAREAARQAAALLQELHRFVREVGPDSGWATWVGAHVAYSGAGPESSAVPPALPDARSPVRSTASDLSELRLSALRASPISQRFQQAAAAEDVIAVPDTSDEQRPPSAEPSCSEHGSADACDGGGSNGGAGGMDEAEQGAAAAGPEPSAGRSEEAGTNSDCGDGVLMACAGLLSKRKARSHLPHQSAADMGEPLQQPQWQEEENTAQQQEQQQHEEQQQWQEQQQELQQEQQEQEQQEQEQQQEEHTQAAPPQRQHRQQWSRPQSAASGGRQVAPRPAEPGSSSSSPCNRPSSAAASRRSTAEQASAARRQSSRAPAVTATEAAGARVEAPATGGAAVPAARPAPSTRRLASRQGSAGGSQAAAQQSAAAAGTAGPAQPKCAWAPTQQEWQQVQQWQAAMSVKLAQQEEAHQAAVAALQERMAQLELLLQRQQRYTPEPALPCTGALLAAAADAAAGSPVLSGPALGTPYAARRSAGGDCRLFRSEEWARTPPSSAGQRLPGLSLLEALADPSAAGTPTSAGTAQMPTPSDIDAAYADALRGGKGDVHLLRLLQRTGPVWAQLSPRTAANLIAVFVRHVRDGVMLHRVLPWLWRLADESAGLPELPREMRQALLDALACCPVGAAEDPQVQDKVSLLFDTLQAVWRHRPCA